MLDDAKIRSPTSSDPLLDGGERGSDHDTLELEELGELPRWASPPAAGLPRNGRCRIFERVALVVLAVLVLVVILEPSLPSAATANVKTFLGIHPQDDDCDAYALPGVLRFDYENRSANFWEPALSQCRPRDYMTALASDRDADNELDFLRGRVVVFFGDSVDRFALKHFCDFCAGELETIGKDHPLMPPLPLGREHAPPGYVSHRNTTDWPASEMGVPHVCRVERHDFHLVNVFQFGLFPEDEALTRHHHFLPPGDFEGRFDTFVVPLLENLAERRRADRAAALAAPTSVSPASSYPISAAPDLFITTATFWNLMRRPDELPLPTGSWAHDLGAWAPPTRERQDWWEVRVQEAVEHVARAWGAARGSTKLVWRRLHTVYGENKWPVMKVRAQDDVAVRVVELLQQESAAAKTGTRWSRWTEDVVPTLGASWRSNRTRDEVRELALGERIKVLEWGKVFDGQQFHGTSDGVHPLPLPGNWVYSNMWLDVLRRHVEQQF